MNQGLLNKNLVERKPRTVCETLFLTGVLQCSYLYDLLVTAIVIFFKMTKLKAEVIVHGENTVMCWTVDDLKFQASVLDGCSCICCTKS